MLNEAAAFFKSHNDILMIAHVSPDGDTLGSCLALCQMARQMGRTARVVCEEPVPQIYRFLPCAGEVLLPRNAAPAEAVVCVDCADIARSGECGAFFRSAKATFNIDHHATNNLYADGNFVKTSAATGELVFTLLEELGLGLTADIATCLFAAIATDTGNFSYSNTTPDTFRITAALLEAGIDLPALNRSLFRTVPARKVVLLGRAIGNMRLFCGDKLGMSRLTQEDLKACRATGEDAEGIIDSIRDIDSVEIAILLRESTDGRIRASLRGKSTARVDGIAVEFGGGGHRFAAGCTLDLPMDEAFETLRRSAALALEPKET